MTWANEDQRGWMAYLASLPASEKCDCGWSRRGECYGSCVDDASKGGVVKCGERDPRSGATCTLPIGHSYPHGGLGRIGAGGRSVTWETPE